MPFRPQCRRWRLQDAKARFSELVRMAHSNGPQLVTLHGRDATRLLLQGPIFERPLSLQAFHRQTSDAPSGNVHPVQALLMWVPKRRLAQTIGFGGDGGPLRGGVGMHKEGKVHKRMKPLILHRLSRFLSHYRPLYPKRTLQLFSGLLMQLAVRPSKNNHK
jgi:hypothetical protein